MSMPRTWYNLHHFNDGKTFSRKNRVLKKLAPMTEVPIQLSDCEEELTKTNDTGGMGPDEDSDLVDEEDEGFVARMKQEELDEAMNELFPNFHGRVEHEAHVKLEEWCNTPSPEGEAPKALDKGLPSLEGGAREGCEIAAEWYQGKGKGKMMDDRGGSREMGMEEGPPALPMLAPRSKRPLDTTLEEEELEGPPRQVPRFNRALDTISNPGPQTRGADLAGGATEGSIIAAGFQGNGEGKTVDDGGGSREMGMEEGEVAVPRQAPTFNRALETISNPAQQTTGAERLPEPVTSGRITHLRFQPGPEHELQGVCTCRTDLGKFMITAMQLPVHEAVSSKDLLDYLPGTGVPEGDRAFWTNSYSFGVFNPPYDLFRTILTERRGTPESKRPIFIDWMQGEWMPCLEVAKISLRRSMSMMRHVNPKEDMVPMTAGQFMGNFCSICELRVDREKVEADLKKNRVENSYVWWDGEKLE